MHLLPGNSRALLGINTNGRLGLLWLYSIGIMEKQGEAPRAFVAVSFRSSEAGLLYAGPLRSRLGK